MFSVGDDYIGKLIRQKAKRLYDVPMELDDIEQELQAVVIEYCNKTPFEKRNITHLTVLINQKLYKIVREYSRFEGCCDESKSRRRNINRPYSLNQLTNNNHYNEDGSDVSIYMNLFRSSADTQEEQLILNDFIKVFRSGLAKNYLEIFDLMLEGINKPRFICEELYGHRDERMCKLISKHMLIIKNKFKDAWYAEFKRTIRY